jgi:hypothetical protein
MKPGSLVRIKKSNRLVIYLGLEDDMYRFWDCTYGVCELWKEKFNLKEKVELVIESR